MKNKRRGKTGWMATKLNMSKAYDRIERDYLEGIMKKMGFHERWIFLIMACVKIISYSIVINGKQHGQIIPTKGLRQGNPLSPYLFLLCAEGLVSLIKQASRIGTL